MVHFGSGMSAAVALETAVEEALAGARAPFGDASPKLAIVFASLSYEGLSELPRRLREALGPDVVVVGGSAASCVLGPSGIARRGLSIVLVGGADIEVAMTTAALEGPDVLTAVPAASRIRLAAGAAYERGFGGYACLVFAPGLAVDGEALVAAVRKGAGPTAQLAGCLTGDEIERAGPVVLADEALRTDRVVLVGLFTRKPLGIAARHGWQAVGPTRTVTRAEGSHLYELDKRPALDVWLEDARRAGARPPADRRELVRYLASYYELGIADAGKEPVSSATPTAELLARAPWGIARDGAIRLSCSIGEGRRVRVLHANRQDMLRAADTAAAEAVARAGGSIAGALVLACSGRHAALGPEFPNEPERIRQRMAAPIGGAGVYGEIARSVRDAESFHNTTAVIVAFAA